MELKIDYKVDDSAEFQIKLHEVKLCNKIYEFMLNNRFLLKRINGN